jgi:uncharacterized protein YidB (DUF937 family)
MGFMDSLENMASQAMEQSGSPTAKVAGGLLSALEQHPGGLAGAMNTMQQNGVDPQQMAAGGATSPDQIEQGLGGTGLIETVAAKAGVSPEVAKELMAVALPMVMAHFTQGGTQAAPSGGGLMSMAGPLLAKFL